MTQQKPVEYDLTSCPMITMDYVTHVTKQRIEKVGNVIKIRRYVDDNDWPGEIVLGLDEFSATELLAELKRVLGSA